MSLIMESLSLFLLGLVKFALYFGLSLLALILFKSLYTRITPYDEWQLVKRGNMAASLALSGAVVGFSIALASAANNSVSIFDFVGWALVALGAQLLAYWLVRFNLPRIAWRIEQDQQSAGLLLGATSVAIGLLNAAAMSY